MVELQRPFGRKLNLLNNKEKTMFNNITVKTDTKVVKDSKISFDNLKESIIHNLQIGTIAYIQIGLDLKSANSNLDKKNYAKLLKEVRIVPRTAERFMKIATDERINAINRNLLPVSWTTTHYLSSLDNEQFEKVKPNIAPLNTKRFYDDILEIDNPVTETWNAFDIKVCKKVSDTDYNNIQKGITKLLTNLEEKYPISYVENESISDKIFTRDNPNGKKKVRPLSKQKLEKLLQEKKTINNALNSHYKTNRSEEQKINTKDIDKFFAIPKIQLSNNTVYDVEEESSDDTMHGVPSKEFSAFKEEKTQEVA